MTPIDLALAALWLALSICSRAALLPLFILSIDCLGFALFQIDFHRYCITALTYFLASQINITIPSSLRYALLGGGLLYFVGAIDDMLYQSLQVSTVYYDVMPYLVIVLNAYIAALLFSDGGRNIDGITDALRRAIVNRRRLRL